MEKALNRAVDILDALLNTGVVILGLIILLVSGYSLLDNLWQYRNAADDSLLAFKPELYQPIRDGQFISADQVAWLFIYDTNIDYPVMQGEDNFDYLNKDPYGDFKLSGSIFLDSRNDREFADEYSVIYGHHMEHGFMFGSLDSFQDQAYFDQHREGLLSTGSTVFDVELFAVCSAEATNHTLFSPTGRTTAEITDFLKENAMIYTEPEPGCRIVALSTCWGDDDMDRLLVFGAIKPRSNTAEGSGTV